MRCWHAALVAKSCGQGCGQEPEDVFPGRAVSERDSLPLGGLKSFGQGC